MVNRRTLGFLLAPLTAPLLYSAAVLARAPSEITIPGLGAALLFPFMFVAPISYLGAILGMVAIPFLHAKGRLSLASLALLGASVGALLGALYLWALSDFRAWSQVSPKALLWFLSVGGSLGIAVALVFWAIAGITWRSSGPSKSCAFWRPLN